MNEQKLSFVISRCYIKRLFFVAIMIFAYYTMTISITYPKESNSSFLRISSDARGSAMADAQGAMTQDVYSMYWNPAGLSNVLLKEFGASYQKAFQGVNYSYLGYAMLTEKVGVVGGQVFFLSSGGITSTYENTDGSFRGFGESFSVADLGVGFSQSKYLSKSLAYGVSIKILSHKIMDQQAFSLAGDLGIIYQPLVRQLKVGGAIQNFSTEYKFINEYLREPWNIRASILYDLEKVPLIAVGDYNLIFGYPNTFSLGMEYRLLDLIYFRAGLKLPPPSGLVSGFNMGLGICLFDLYQFDYAFSFHSALGANQRFSLILRF